MENDKCLEHETKFLPEHLAKVWEFIQPHRKEIIDVTQSLGSMSMQGSPASLTAFNSTLEFAKAPDLLRKLETLEKKSMVMENIVCVLNREVERASVVTEEAMKLRRTDQEKIDSLTNKVSLASCLTSSLWVEALCLRVILSEYLEAYPLGNLKLTYWCGARAEGLKQTNHGIWGDFRGQINGSPNGTIVFGKVKLSVAFGMM